jgi:XTP/dITP diphosphohydrolase
MKRVVFASNNAGKVREVAAMLEGVGIELVPQSEFGVPSVEETGLSFVENALLKARHAAQLTGLPAIADDSGLEVDALDGAPGIYSARYAGAGADDAANNTKLLAALRDVPAEQRTARFQSLMVFLRHPLDPTPLICQGTWQGLIAQATAGTAGFGYDPLFQVPEFNCTAAELDPATKNQLSHRGQALRCLLQALGNRR